MTIDEIIEKSSEHMKRSVEVLAEEFASVRTGRATTSLFEKIQVEAYGSEMPLNQMANIKASDAQTVVIEPWDRSVMSHIDKAIRASDLGLTPSNDGTVLRVAFPALTEERRKELVKLCKNYAEDGRVAVRNVRQKTNRALEDLKGSEGVSEDDIHRASESVQKLTDGVMEDVTKLLEKKEAEIMAI
ncbi:MAG: ribosome recycling factor [Coriobacteriia bacterium]|nr:ribosome recycling factor [Coriobacteriia bacterium]